MMAALQEPLNGAGLVKIGPFLSVTDGKTPMMGLTINQADVRLSKNNEDYAQKNEASVAVHDANGWYDVALDGTDLSPGYAGHLLIAVNVVGALPVWRKFAVSVPNPA